MARPREFDENEVLDKALQAFWAHGYDATSVEDLVAATGLARASLYGAFGDKEQLFHRVLKHYLVQSDREITEATRGLSARQAVEAFVQRRLQCFCSKETPKGCFAQVSSQTGSASALIQEVVLEGARQNRAWTVRQIKAAQADGDVASDADAGALADFLIVVVTGLAASARAGMSQRSLSTSAEEALKFVFARNARSK
jgi:AcrR family transcriptional regulator